MGVNVELELNYDNVKNVRALVFCADRKNIFLVKRKKNGKVYWTYPGGWVDDGEKPQEALERELMEELGIKAVKITPFINNEFKEKDGSIVNQLFFTCKEAEEFKRVAPTGPEFLNPEEDNKYEVVIVPLSDIKRLAVLPLDITEMFCWKYDINEEDGFVETM